MLIKIKALQLLHSIPSRDLLLHSKDNPSLRYEALCKQASSLLQPHWFSAVLWLSCFSPDLRFTAPPSYIYLNTTSLACLSTSCFLSHVQLFVTQWPVICQAPLSMEFSRQEYWSRLPFPSPGDLPDPEIEPRSPASQVDALLSEPPGTMGLLLTHCKLKI